MSSLITDFDYDIFISYRHNDNLDGWVTDFVQNLEKELRSTLKDSLTIYFDKNPHDGLLETHNVDKSLEGKLKCLIFIPIISQTYCDPKSFAWQHEFCAFNKLSKEDQFGRDIKLSSGNVASRILPIKIHDLDQEDKTLLENEMGGVLRAIEFIFKSSGVNRPLTPDDKREENSTKTFYRDQINKAANAIKEIVSSLKSPISQTSGTVNHQLSMKPKSIRRPLLMSIILLGLIVIGFFIYRQRLTNNQQPLLEKSIAVLPFVDMSPGHDQEYLGDGIAEEIITALSRINGLKVIGRTSSFQFKGEKVDLRDVGEKLNVSSVLEGSVMKSGNKIRITAQLINVSDGAHIWAEHYDKPMDDIFAIHDQISKAISDKMKISLMGNPNRSERKPTSSTEAYENYLRGNQILKPGSGKEARPFFEKAIQLDSGYADAYAGLALSYFFSWEGGPSENFDRMLPLAMKVLELDPESEKSHEILYIIYGSYYKWDWKTSNDEYQKYLSINPMPAVSHALDVAYIMGDVKGGIKDLEQNLEVDPINTDVLRLLGYLYALDKQFAKGKELINKAIEIDPAYGVAYRGLATLNILAGEYDLALKNLADADRFDGNKKFINNAVRIWALVKAGRLGEAKKVYATMDLSKEDDGSGLYLKMATKAKIEFLMGHVDEGFRWLEKALKQREMDVLTIRFNPGYDVIRNHPRFKEFMKKVPFPLND